MFKDRAMELVTALRSGKYTQCTGQLRTTDDRFCCLGVACDILEDNPWELNNWGEFEALGEMGCLPSKIQDHYGFNGDNGPFVADSVRWPESLPVNLGDSCLTELNDSGFTFSQIADFIELNWEKL